ncbi:TonB-dependent receptor plug domain-containing protein [Komagataeibacter europaeus]|uniref:TonB-dependent receptor plug domain-containing protein n=1 Tax=Komagataeibacter europaeus TaxID=33995 RepID=UPI0018DED9F0|nr:TonB-dependent receptor [Komagataeibacter europaeus]
MNRRTSLLITTICSLVSYGAVAATPNGNSVTEEQKQKTSTVHTQHHAATAQTHARASQTLKHDDSGGVNSSGVETINVSTGTHSVNRKARDSMSPVSVIGAAALRRSGQMNLADALTRTNASINVSAMGADAGALTSAIRMRGLNPNEVLVLVDGKRRHTTANLYADSGPESGSTPVDLNMIPANAIDHIEVLEDGAAAMYGSDAIAGVVNIITKKQDHGLNLSGQTGANAYNGDGWNYQLNADGGMKLGQDGFLHISGQMYHTDHFVANNARDHRLLGSQPADASTASYTGVNAGKISDRSNKIMSTPEETRENLAIEWGKQFTPGINFYGLITYAHRHAEAYENYRTPTVGDSCAACASIAPFGFSPLETMEENDFAATLGLKGDNFMGFNWDISSTYGEDIDKIGNKNTLNTAYVTEYGSSPRTARAETYSMTQWTNNVDFRRHFNIGNAVPMTLAFGAEERMESYNITAGEPVSYTSGGTQGYAGISPGSAGTWYRDIWAWYMDGDFRLTKKWELDFAGRLEHYTDVGNTENGKISTRYNFNKRIAIRGTISTGFRAPTLAESHFSAVNVSPTGASGLLAADSAAAQAIGATKLKPERSTSVSGGIVLEPVDGFHVEADVYQINLRDRIVQDTNFGGSTPYGNTTEGYVAAQAIAQLASLPTGFSGYNDVYADYFTNGASTRTQGVDIKADYLFHFHKYGNLALSMSIDLNRTRLHHNGSNLNLADIASITSDNPRSKIILNAYYTYKNWDFNIRQTRYGQTSDMVQYQDWGPAALQYSNNALQQFINTPHWMTDIEIGVRFQKNWHFAVGANDVFNVRPRMMSQELNALGAMPYDENSAQIPITGGYYYGRLNANF